MLCGDVVLTEASPLKEARTLNQIFEQYKASPVVKVRWRDWWLDQWREQVELYRKLGWFLILIGPRCKKPIGGFRWGKGVKLKTSEIIEHLQDNGNLAVVAGFSKPKLVILDVDTHDVPPHILDKSYTQITPRGYGVFLKGPYDSELFEKIKARYPFFDTPRVDILYALVPLSVSCTGETKATHVCSKHNYLVREWIHKGPIMNFEQYAKAILECP